MRLTFVGTTSHATTATAQPVIIGNQVERVRSPFDQPEGRSYVKSALLLQQREATIELSTLEGTASSAGDSRAASRPVSPVGQMEPASRSGSTFLMGTLAEIRGVDDGPLSEARTSGGMVHRLALCPGDEWTVYCWIKLPAAWMPPPERPGDIRADPRPLCAAIVDPGCVAGRPLSHVLLACGQDNGEQYVRLGACFGVGDGACTVHRPCPPPDTLDGSTHHIFHPPITVNPPSIDEALPERFRCAIR